MTSLADALKEAQAIKFGEFTLASGKKSKYYIDIKKASTNPRILKMIGKKISEIMKLHFINADYIAGVALGGVPIAVAVSLETDLPLIIIRKETKEYGTKGQIIGEHVQGKSILLVEDVTTTGSSVLNAIKLLRTAGLVVQNVITVVDREEGASKTLSAVNVKFVPLVRIGELLKN